MAYSGSQAELVDNLSERPETDIQVESELTPAIPKLP
jgi:hypothetical protein